MCGICGFTGKSDILALKRMLDSIRHRGPDEDGYYSDDKINLGIRRLCIIDVETGHQPIHNEDKSLWTIFNGEIYNFKELRKELEDKGHRFYTDHSDTEVIIHLYEEYGINFLHKLNGMFAIALWDKINDRLFLIRDRMGVKPLFYTITQGRLIFASEIKAILANPLYNREINYEAIYHYFTFKNIPSPLTAFKEIYSLLCGEMLTFSNQKITKNRWWKINFNEKNDYNLKHVSNKILALLEDATRLRMISDVPFGAYLSGGIDSSSVVSLMTRFSDEPIKTFSLGYEDALKNKEADLYYARKISQAYKTEHYEYIMSYKELINDMEKAIKAFDQPFSGTISTYFLTKLITQHVKVALSGDGADELFGSYLSHRVAQPIYYFKRLYNKLKSNQLTENERRLFLPCDTRFLEELLKKSKGNEAKWRYCLCIFSDEEKDNLLNADFKSRINSASSFYLMEKHFDTLTARDPLNRILEMEWNTQLPDQILAFVDFLSMAHSVEIRSPFLDYRLVEFVATIPGSMKIRDGNVKAILKETVRDLLPEGLTERPKEGFVMPIFTWIDTKLRSYIENMLSPERIAQHGLWNSDYIAKLMNEHYSGKAKHPAKLWNLVCFQIWWETLV